MDVSENSGSPKSSILIGFSIFFTIHFGGTPIFGNTHIHFLSLKFFYHSIDSVGPFRGGCVGNREEISQRKKNVEISSSLLRNSGESGEQVDEPNFEPVDY